MDRRIGGILLSISERRELGSFQGGDLLSGCCLSVPSYSPVQLVCQRYLRTGVLGHSFLRYAFHDHRIAGPFHIDRVKGDRRRLVKLQLPVGVRRFQPLLVHDGHKFLRQTTVVAFHARYPYPGAGLIVGRTVLQRVWPACGQHAIFDLPAI